MIQKKIIITIFQIKLIFSFFLNFSMDSFKFEKGKKNIEKFKCYLPLKKQLIAELGEKHANKTLNKLFKNTNNVDPNNYCQKIEDTKNGKKVFSNIVVNAINHVIFKKRGLTYTNNHVITFNNLIDEIPENNIFLDNNNFIKKKDLINFLFLSYENNLKNIKEIYNETYEYVENCNSNECNERKQSIDFQNYKKMKKYINNLSKLEKLKTNIYISCLRSIDKNGCGAFANQDFNKDDLVDYYSGEIENNYFSSFNKKYPIYHKKQILEIYGNYNLISMKEYFINFKSENAMDCGFSNNNPWENFSINNLYYARNSFFINNSEYKNFKTSSNLYTSGYYNNKYNSIFNCFFAKDDIPKNSELFFSYKKNESPN